MSNSSGGHNGIVISLRPKKYPRTRQQEELAKAAAFCGIRKGMTRPELIHAMRECIPTYFERVRNGEDPTTGR